MPSGLYSTFSQTIGLSVTFLLILAKSGPIFDWTCLIVYIQIGLIADMSSTNAPAVSQNIPLGLAQIEELQEALNELKVAKTKRLGCGRFKTVAFTETFRSQAEYAMASGFDEVQICVLSHSFKGRYLCSRNIPSDRCTIKIYCQPSGEIPLVGISSTVTFYSRLLEWLGIKVHAEARTDYKSMVRV